MCCCKNKCFITAEVLTSAANVNLPAGINERIQNNVVTSIWAPRSGSNTLKTQSGKTVASDIVMATAHLFLLDSNGKQIVVLPMWMIMRDFNSPEPLQGEWANIDVTQSYILLDIGASGWAATQAIELTFGYNCEKC